MRGVCSGFGLRELRGEHVVTRGDDIIPNLERGSCPDQSAHSMGEHVDDVRPLARSALTCRALDHTRDPSHRPCSGAVARAQFSPQILVAHHESHAAACRVHWRDHRGQHLNAEARDLLYVRGGRRRRQLDLEDGPMTYRHVLRLRVRASYLRT